MKKLAALALAAASAGFLSTQALAAGDPVVGKQKATACIACHGSDAYPGIFYTLQLGGRNADKLEIKTMKYKTGKILHPMMNMAVAFFDEKEIRDISAYYQSLGKPAFTSSLIKIKTDDDDAKAPAPMAMPYAPMGMPTPTPPPRPSNEPFFAVLVWRG
jgi:cytochrome c553